MRKGGKRKVTNNTGGRGAALSALRPKRRLEKGRGKLKLI